MVETRQMFSFCIGVLRRENQSDVYTERWRNWLMGIEAWQVQNLMGVSTEAFKFQSEASVGRIPSSWEVCLSFNVFNVLNEARSCYEEWSPFISSKHLHRNTIVMFDLIAGQCGPAKLTLKICHHSFIQSIWLQYNFVFAWIFLKITIFL